MADGDVAGTGTIEDDDDPPSLSVADATGSEGGTLAFEVELGASGRTATVDYATSDGTAVAGEDYQAAEGVLTFAPGESTLTVSVTLLNDGVAEPSETFVVRLGSPTNATLAVGDATGTIEDVDELPALSVAGGEGVEGGTVGFVPRPPTMPRCRNRPSRRPLPLGSRACWPLPSRRSRARWLLTRPPRQNRG